MAADSPSRLPKSRFLSFRPARIANTRHSSAATSSEFRPRPPRSSFPRREAPDWASASSRGQRGGWVGGGTHARVLMRGACCHGLGRGAVHHPLRLRKLSNALDWLVWIAPSITPARPLCQPRSKRESGLVGGQMLGRSRAAYGGRHVRPPAYHSSDDASAIESWQRIPEVCTPKPLIPPMAWHFTGRLTETAPAMAANSRREYSCREFAAIWAREEVGMAENS